MQCPQCHLGGDTNHRACIVTMFRENRIQSVEDWEAMCRTIVKGKRWVRILPTPTSDVPTSASSSTPTTRPTSLS